MRARVTYALNGAYQLILDDGRLLKVPSENSKVLSKFISHGDTGTLYNNEKQQLKFQIDAEDILYEMKPRDIITLPNIKEPTMRNLASIKPIETISPIDGADAIDVATIGGWNIVVKKGTHSVGELVVYLEIDSWVPEHVAPFLCNPDSPKSFQEVAGARLRTKKLRGVVSQGLILSVNDIEALNGLDIVEDMDVTELLGILKYEKPLNANLAGTARGNFPLFIPKTDQERVQNLKQRELDSYVGLHFEVTEKIDGSSVTVYTKDNEEDDTRLFGVCSRNLDLKETEFNSFWIGARSGGFISALEVPERNLAIQGELAGGNIQSKYTPEISIYVFDIYDIESRQYFNAEERLAFCAEHNLKHSPVLDKSFLFTAETTREFLLNYADGQSELNNKLAREGVVFKCIEKPEISFKVISNKWLLKNDG